MLSCVYIMEITNYKCSHCDYTTIDKSKYDKHLATDIHNENKCEYCEKKFASSVDMQNHKSDKCIAYYRSLAKAYKEVNSNLNKEITKLKIEKCKILEDSIMNTLDYTADFFEIMSKQRN